MPSIDVVIPTHNRWELTKSCLEHLRRQTVPHRVVVSDNGSTDGTPRRVAVTAPDADVLELGVNVGFSAACNRGVRAGSSEIVILLNNDVDCRDDFLEHLVAPFGTDERIGSVTPLLLTPDLDTIESFGLAVDPTFAGYPRLRGMPAVEAQATRPVLVGPSGAAAAFRRRAWVDAGGLDELVFAYGEDVDLALRLRAAGWSTVAAVDASAVHRSSATAVARSSWQRYQGGFSRGYFMRRYGVLSSRTAVRALATEAIAVGGDTLLFSRDLAAFRGRVAGWQAARGLPPKPQPPPNAIDDQITFLRSLRLRYGIYTERTAPCT